MKFGRKSSRRSGRKPARKALSLFTLESLEARQLLAGSITIEASGATSTLTPSILSELANYSNNTDFTLTPDALTGASSGLIFHATGAITFDDPVANLPVSLDAESEAQIAVNADISSTPGNDITLVGSNSLSGMVTESGVVFKGSTVSSGGDLTVTGVGYGSCASTGVYGVYLNDSTLTTVGSAGDVSVTGTIATANNGDDVGVLIGGGSAITTGSGSITVSGASAGTSGDFGHNYGVFDDGGSITSVTGAVSVVGTGAGGSDDDDNFGVLVWASGFVADVSDSDDLGTGGTSTSALITSINGPVTVTGTGGGTGDADGGLGVYVNTGGAIGTGDLDGVTVKGTGGVGSGGYNIGVLVQNSDDGPAAQITSGGGDVSVSGAGMSGSSVSPSVVLPNVSGGYGYSYGVEVGSQGWITAGGTGALTITGESDTTTGMNQVGVYVGDGAEVASSGGDVTIHGQGGGNSSDGGSSDNDGVEVSDFGSITAGGMGQLSIDGTGGDGGGGDNAGVAVMGDGGSAIVSSSDGGIYIKGTGGGAGTSSGNNVGVLILPGGQVISTGFGSVAVDGYGGTSGGSDNDGILVDGFGVPIDTGIVSEGGHLYMDGEGGGTSESGGANDGVVIQSWGYAGTSGAGGVTISGTGGPYGSNNVGVDINSGGVWVDQGALSVFGHGGGSSDGTGNTGIAIIGNSEFWAGGGGAVNLDGVAGPGDDYDYGVEIDSNEIGSSDGEVSVTGTGGDATSDGEENYGVYAYDATIAAGGDGTTTVAGTGGSSSSDGYYDDGVYLESSIITSSAGDVAVTGTAGSAVGGYWNIGVYLDDVSEITSGGSGAVTVTGSGGADSSDGEFDAGVYFEDDSTITSGGGAVSVTGTGGATAGGDEAYGIYLDDESTITAGGMGKVTVDGTGGDGGALAYYNYGVYLEDGSTITSSGGTVSVTGVGGSGYYEDYGIYVDSSTITSGGDGSVALTGTGGTGTEPEEDSDVDYNIGIYAYDSTITTGGDGAVTLTGTGGASTDYQDGAAGIWIEDGMVTSGGSGDVTLAGIGGAVVNGEDNYGVYIGDGATLTSGGGDVTVVGTGGAATSEGIWELGVYVYDDSTITSGGDGRVSITGTGGMGPDCDDNDGVYLDDDVMVTAGGTGDVTVNGAVAPDSSGEENDGVYLDDSTITSGGGDVTVAGTGGPGGPWNYGIDLDDSTISSTVDGDVNVTATAGSGGPFSNIGLYLDEATITAWGTGDVTVAGIGGGSTYGGNYGVSLDGSTITSDGGNVIVTGTGGPFGDHEDSGIVLFAGSLITAGATGNVTVDGTAGASNYGGSDGVRVDDSEIASNGGGVTVTGIGGTGDGGNIGVYVENGSTITSGGFGDVTIDGTGGASASDDYGVAIDDSTISSEDYEESVEPMIPTSGTGAVTVTGIGGGSAGGGENYGIDEDGGTITSGGGDVTVIGTGGAGDEDNAGVDLDDSASITSTNSGSVSVTGLGGGNFIYGSFNYGIFADDDSTIASGGAGAVTVTGTGGAGDFDNTGVIVEGGSIVTSGSGDVTVIGTGGAALDDPLGETGVWVNAAEITAGGTGSVTVIGTGVGGYADGTYNEGVWLAGGTITSSGGDVTVTGVAGASADGGDNYGVYLDYDSMITAGGTGDVAVSGTGGDTGSGGENHGVYLSYSTITSGGGDVTVTGTAGTGGDNNVGVYLSDGATIESGGDGDVSVTGTGGASDGGDGNAGVYLIGEYEDPTITASGTGDVDVTGTGGDSDFGGNNDSGVYVGYDSTIDSSGGSVTVAGQAGNGADNNYGVLFEESTIASGGDGDVAVTGTGGASDGGVYDYGVRIEWGAMITAGGTGDVAVTGIGGPSDGGDHNGGLYIQYATITSGGGDVTVVGTGADSGAEDDGVELHVGTISSGGDGDVSVTGTGGASTNGHDNDGVYLEPDEGGRSMITAGGTGDVSVTGTGGASTGGYANMGVYLEYSTITSDGGGVTVAGTGGAGGYVGFGILVEDGSTITSGGGDVTLDGTGGASDGGSSNFGVFDGYGSTIAATGSGDVSVSGTGGDSGTGTENYGVFVLEGATITSDDGDVTVSGTAGSGADSDIGVFLLDGATITSGASGDVTVTGYGGQDGGDSVGVKVVYGSAISSPDGPVTVTGTGGGASGGGGDNYGVYVHDGSSITSGTQEEEGVVGPDVPSSGGPVEVTGTGGVGGEDDAGVYVGDASITSTNANSVTVEGTGGQSEGWGSDGVDVDGATIAAQGTGDVTLTGRGGKGPYGGNYGIAVYDGSSLTSAGGAITVTGTGGGTVGGEYDTGVSLFDGATILASETGSVDVQGSGGAGGYSYGVALFGGGDEGPTAIGSEGGDVTVAGIGGGQSGDVGYDDGVMVIDGAQITASSGSVTVTGTGGPGGGYSDGVLVASGGIITSSGALTITGTGGGASGDQGYDVGIDVESGGTIESPSDVTLQGSGGPGMGYDVGVQVEGSVNSNSNLTVTGTGGGSNGSQGYDDGVTVDSGGSISAYGDLSVTGYGGSGGMGEDDGVRVTGLGSAIIADGSSLEVDGTGGGDGNSAFSSGIAILDAGQIVWDGYPEIGSEAIIGYGGIGEGGGNDGLLIDGEGSGIVFDSDLDEDSDIEGYSGQPGAAPGYGIQMTGGAEIDGETESASLDLYLDADTMMVDASSTLDSPDNEVNVQIDDSGTIAGDVTSSDFRKSGDGTLTLEATGSLDLGEVEDYEGTLVFAAVPPLILPEQAIYVWPGATLTLGAGSNVPEVNVWGATLDGSDVGGNVGGILSYEGGSTISPGSAGTAGILAFDGMYLNSSDTVVFKIGGASNDAVQPIPGIDYDQLQLGAAGETETVAPLDDGSAIDLNGANLDLEAFGNITAEPGAVYTLISNPAGGPIEGTFYDQAEGSTVSVDDIPFILSYRGGASGNDVTLTEVGDTTTTVASLTGPSDYGQMVTFEAHVAGIATSLIPTGVVDFFLGSTLLGSATLDADGNAVLSTGALPAGSPAVTASYEGAANFLVSSDSVDQDISPVTPEVELATANATTVAGEAVTFIGSVLPATPGSLAPTGTATFYDETTDTILATGVPLVNGQAVLTLSTLAAGSHTIQFTYDTGDDNYDANTTGATVTQTVDQDATTTTITSTAPNTVSGQSVRFTVAVASDAPGAGTPTGQVTLIDTTTDTEYGPFTLSDGSASFTVSDLSFGSHSFTATYVGDEDYTSSSSGMLPQTVAMSDTTIGVTSATNPGTFGTSVTLTAVVRADAPGSGTPTGSLDYTIDGVTASAIVIDGTATIVLPDLAAGSTAIAFSYAGDADFNASTANFTEVMNTAAPTAALAPSSASVAYGQAGTYVVTLTGIDGVAPTGSVQLDLNGAFYSQATLVTSEGATAAATFNVNGLDPATYTLQATYAGDETYQPAQTATASLTVAAAATQVTGVSSSISSPTVGATISLSAQVSVTTGAGTPIGMVVFLDTTDPSNPIVLGRADVLNGEAVLDNVGFVNAGVHDVTAEYQPQGPDFAGSSASTSIDVNAIATTLQLLTPTIAYTQSSVTLTAMVGAPGVVNVGTVSFYDNGIFIGSSPVNGAGVATLSVTDLSLGTQDFTAAYVDPPDTSFGSSSTSIVSTTNVEPNPLTPIEVATSVTVTPIYLPPPSNVPASFGGRNTRLKFAVQLVNPMPNVPTPTGTVTVYANGHAIGTYNLDAQGTATIVLHGKTVYDKSIVVTYNGNVQGITTFAPSSSTPFVADRAYFYSNSPENGGSSSTVKRGVHPAGPAKFRPAAHKAKVEVPAVHVNVHKTKVLVPMHRKLS